MGGIKLWHILVLVIAFVVLFGWKNLPSAARSLGESMRIFKSEVDQMKDDSEGRKDRAAGESSIPGTTTDRVGGTGTDAAPEAQRRLEERGDDGSPRA